MTDYAAELAASSGTTMTQRTGTASADTVPAGATLVVQNTGAGSHNITLACNQLTDGLATSSRVVAVPAAGFKSIFVPNFYGDANGRVAISIDGTATEVKYFVMT